MAIALIIYEIVCTVTKMKCTIQRPLYWILSAAFLACACVPHCVQAQDKKKSQVFRTSENISLPFVLPSTLDLQLLEAFVLMQKANAGESPAQHELGVRYLLGRGFPADTVKAAYWIQKAADQRLPLAEFNLGILFMNGMGLEWDPFKAYYYFCAAADEEMPEALYVKGLIYTEDFIVPRNWPVAYHNFKRAAELGSNAAKISMKEMIKRGLDTTETKEAGGEQDTASHTIAPRTKSSDNRFSLLFIDFHNDTISTIEDTTLIHEAFDWKKSEGSEESSQSETTSKLDSSTQSSFSAFAEAGNPEALCLMGRCYEHGLNVPRNIILAGVYYLRALHLDSYRASSLLWKLMVSEEFSRELEVRTSQNDPDALYVWSGLTSIGFNKLLNEKQAFEILQRAASTDHVPSLVELGSCYFTGRWTRQNRDKAVECWTRASALGSKEADIRLAAANALGQIHTQDADTAIALLRSTEKQGSLFSELTIAYCYDKGITLPKDKGQAYRMFHRALLRGSEAAFHALRSMHDDIRPAEKKFHIPD